jgi:hypothetical protein
MSSNRPKLQLDEQSFQDLLAAAFTIQEHADLLKPVTKVGPTVAREAQAEAPSVRQERPPQVTEESVLDLASSGSGMAPETANQPLETRSSQHDDSANETEWEIDPPVDVEQTLLSPPLTTEDNWLTVTNETNHGSSGPRKALLDLRQLLNRRRADLYLGIAVLVAVLAVFWPTPATPQKPHLEPWQRVLVTLGIAEAPPPPIHYRGDPNIEVWVDPHTALYYCPGDEPYGKAADGRLTSQREAQADQFEPANRAACN